MKIGEFAIVCFFDQFQEQAVGWFVLSGGDALQSVIMSDQLNDDRPMIKIKFTNQSLLTSSDPVTGH